MLRCLNRWSGVWGLRPLERHRLALSPLLWYCFAVVTVAKVVWGYCCTSVQIDRVPPAPILNTMVAQTEPLANAKLRSICVLQGI